MFTIENYDAMVRSFDLLLATNISDKKRAEYLDRREKCKASIEYLKKRETENAQKTDA